MKSGAGLPNVLETAPKMNFSPGPLGAHSITSFLATQTDRYNMSIANPCEQLKCNRLCLLAPGGGASCACPGTEANKPGCSSSLEEIPLPWPELLHCENGFVSGMFGVSSQCRCNPGWEGRSCNKLMSGFTTAPPKNGTGRGPTIQEPSTGRVMVAPAKNDGSNSILIIIAVLVLAAALFVAIIVVVYWRRQQTQYKEWAAGGPITFDPTKGKVDFSEPSTPAVSPTESDHAGFDNPHYVSLAELEKAGGRSPPETPVSATSGDKFYLAIDPTRNMPPHIPQESTPNVRTSADTAQLVQTGGDDNDFVDDI